jgi:hypothetical protein
LPFVVGAVHFAENVDVEEMATDFHSFQGLVPRRFWMLTFVQVGPPDCAGATCWMNLGRRGPEGDGRGRVCV